VAERRLPLLPVVAAGLSAAAFAALAGNQDWARLDGSADSSDPAVVRAATLLADATAPPVTALALVVLATWGVVLVSRGRARLAVTWLGLVAALGVLVFAVLAWAQTPATVAEAAADGQDASRTAWAYLGVLAAAAAVATSAAAAASVGHWPEMGRRYDAPGGAADDGVAATRARVEDEEQTNLDLWRAIDEGHDPTEGPAR
jgi:uncharacterized membrane protein (TIGR02234 family)